MLEKIKLMKDLLGKRCIISKIDQAVLPGLGAN